MHGRNACCIAEMTRGESKEERKDGDKQTHTHALSLAPCVLCCFVVLEHSFIPSKRYLCRQHTVPSYDVPVVLSCLRADRGCGFFFLLLPPFNNHASLFSLALLTPHSTPHSTPFPIVPSCLHALVVSFRLNACLFEAKPPSPLLLCLCAPLPSSRDSREP